MAQDNSNSTMEMGTSDQVLVASKRKRTLKYAIGGGAMLVVIGVVVALVVVLSGNEGGTAEPIISTTEGPSSVDPIPSTPTTVDTTTTVTPPTTESTPDPTPDPTTAATTTTVTPPMTESTSDPTPDPTTAATTTTVTPPMTESTSDPTPDPTTAATTTTVTPPTTDPTASTVTPTTPPPEEEFLNLDSIINGVFTPNSFNAIWKSGNEVMYRNANGDLVLQEAGSGIETTLIANSSTLLQQSSRVTLLSPDGDMVVLAHSVIPNYRYSFIARYTVVDLASGNETDIGPTSMARSDDPFLQNFIWGPSGSMMAFVYMNNIYYQASLESDPEPITTTGDQDVIYHGIPDWVYEEEVFGSNNAMWFSADGSKLAYATFNDTEVRRMRVPHFGIPGSLAHQYTQHSEIRYPKPGTVNPTVSVTLRDLSEGLETVFNAPVDVLDEPILKSVQFVSNDTVALMWTNRVQTSLIVDLCPFNASCDTIFTYSETNGWIDNIPMMFNSQGNAFITILPQAVNNVLYKQIVQVQDVNADLWTASGRSNTAHTVGEILLWTDDDVIWYKATHVDDSAEQHIYSLNATGFVSCFTCDIVRDDGGRCLYNEAVISQGGSRIALTCAGPNIPQTFIYDADGTRLRVWDENVEISLLVGDNRLPEIIRPTIPALNNFPAPDVHIQVPHDYENRTDIPLLVYVYGGPDTAMVTKQWNVDWGTSLVTRWGIAVAHIDGRGSGLKGVANMFAVNRQLGTVEIEDQIRVTRYLQNNLRFDANRTCIWGWSYGGYAASLALARGDGVFRCAAAVAPVVDWRFYDTIYTERYMDLPRNNPEGYLNSSLLDNSVAEAYRDKSYMLIHGTADDNVHFQHAMLISRLLQRRDVQFTQMSYTDEDHSLIGVRPHLYHGLEKFLRENML